MKSNQTTNKQLRRAIVEINLFEIGKKYNALKTSKENRITKLQNPVCPIQLAGHKTLCYNIIIINISAQYHFLS